MGQGNGLDGVRIALEQSGNVVCSSNRLKNLERYYLRILSCINESIRVVLSTMAIFAQLDEIGLVVYFNRVSLNYFVGHQADQV